MAPAASGPVASQPFNLLGVAIRRRCWNVTACVFSCMFRVSHAGWDLGVLCRTSQPAKPLPSAKVLQVVPNVWVCMGQIRERGGRLRRRVMFECFEWERYLSRLPSRLS
eukprot:2551371-Prymnesium_polylepis.2